MLPTLFHSSSPTKSLIFSFIFFGCFNFLFWWDKSPENNMDPNTDENSNKRSKHDEKKIKGTVVLMKKSLLDFDGLSLPLVDRIEEVVGQKVSLQLISAVNGDPGKFLSYSLSVSCFLYKKTTNM
ncbi:hypothetical protein CsSME_00010782 [Camellia sinensis var. sinensis]